jgi:hypothetical protein
VSIYPAPAPKATSCPIQKGEGVRAPVCVCLCVRACTRVYTHSADVFVSVTDPTIDSGISAFNFTPSHPPASGGPSVKNF